MKNIAYIGLGIMGSEMAKHLKNAGHEISVWNRDYRKSEKFVSKYGGVTSQDIIEVVKNADLIFMCLGDDKSVENIVDKIKNTIKNNTIIIDHTTISAEMTRKLFDECKQKNINFIDAPVTGGQSGAQNGTLTIMCGGDEEVFNEVKPVMQAYGTKIEYFGISGNGQLCKMVNQICIAGAIQCLAEAVSFAEKSGIDGSKLFKIINTGAGSSWQMNNRIDWMLAKNYQENQGFPVEWMVKDLDICIDEATKIDADLNITKKIKENFKKVRDEINPRIDTSSLILLFKNN